jgi:hypothetical protein
VIIGLYQPHREKKDLKREMVGNQGGGGGVGEVDSKNSKKGPTFCSGFSLNFWFTGFSLATPFKTAGRIN